MTRAQAERLARYWGVNDPEDFSATDPDEAVGDYLENCQPVPEKVTLHAFVPQKPNLKVCGSPLEYVLERLDEEFQRDEGHGPTEKMLQAEQRFLRAVVREYRAFWCNEIYIEEVDVREWCERTGNMQLLEG